MNASDQFEAVVREYYEPLFRFAISLTQSESDAWDLTQQTFYVWATKGDQLRDVSKAKPWLFTTLHRAFLATRRKQSRFPHEELDAVTEKLPSEASLPSEGADSSQVLLALSKVDEVYRAAVALFYLDDCPYREIAVILEVPIGTVKSRIARGIEQLRGILRPCSSPSAGREAGYTAAGEAPDHDSSNARVQPRPPARLDESQFETSLAEWDFSSTFLWELSAVV